MLVISTLLSAPTGNRNSIAGLRNWLLAQNLPPVQVVTYLEQERPIRLPDSGDRDGYAGTHLPAALRPPEV